MERRNVMAADRGLACCPGRIGRDDAASECAVIDQVECALLAVERDGGRILE